MADQAGKKRQRTDQNRRRHDRNKFRRTTNATQQRKSLGCGLKGILVSCTPRKEIHAFREAVIMLGKYCEDDANKVPEGGCDDPEIPEKNDKEEKTQDEEPDNGAKQPKQKVDSTDVTKALQEELKEIRDPEQKLFTRVDGGVNGSVFLCIDRSDIDTEKVVECALQDARASGSPNSRHCIRIMPIHTTCYAKPDDAAKAAVEVVKQHFPSIDGQDSPVTYAISFKARLNTNAHRDEFITEMAKAIDEYDPRYKVNLTAPDVTLIVEILKTSCCIGTFRHFYQLAKMNLREAASPSKPKDENAKPMPALETGDEKKQSAKATPNSEPGTVKEEAGTRDKGGETKTPTAEGTDGEQMQKDEPAPLSGAGTAKVAVTEAATVGENGAGDANDASQGPSGAKDAKGKM